MIDAAVGSAGDEARRGATSYLRIDPSALRQLEAAKTETATHIEQMAMDMGALFEVVLPNHPDVRGASASLREGPFLQRMRTGGRLLIDHLGAGALTVAASSRSDVVRGWGAFAVGMIHEGDIARSISAALPFADDPHFAVREWAWLGIRSEVVAEPTAAIALLSTHIENPSGRIRRFCIEATRPVSVWGAHCSALRSRPELATRLLDAAATDDDRYVERSVGNWLNDARRTRPNWVATTCKRWQLELGVPDRLIRRALRLSAGQPISLGPLSV